MTLRNRFFFVFDFFRAWHSPQLVHLFHHLVVFKRLDGFSISETKVINVPLTVRRQAMYRGTNLSSFKSGS